MTGRKKLVVGVGLAAVMLLATVAMAFAVPMLSLTATKSVVTYPHMTSLKLRAADGDTSTATTVTVQYRPVGAPDWKKFRTISASRTGEGTVTIAVPPTFLKSTTGFRAIATEGLESSVVTVTVKAKLSKAIAPATIRGRRCVTVRGFIWPAHAVGTRPVTVKVWKWENGAWVLKARLHPKIVGKHGDRSMWAFTKKVSKADKGKWRLQVSHVDAKHACSRSAYSYLRVK